MLSSTKHWTSVEEKEAKLQKKLNESKQREADIGCVFDVHNYALNEKWY